MNKSMLAGIGIGVAAALGVAAVASLNVFERGPQYAQVVSATPIKETVKTPRQECRNVTVTHRRLCCRMKIALPGRCSALLLAA